MNENDESTLELESVIESVPVMIAGGSHTWRQQGPYLICRTCPHIHTQYVGVNKRMVGEKDGEPILEDCA